MNVAVVVASLIAVALLQPTKIAYRPACEGCAIVAESLVTIGRTADSVLLAEPQTPARDSRGVMYAISFDRSGVVVFSEHGQLRAKFGRKGDGPGEFGGNGAMTIAVGRGDTVFVTDTRNRVSVFSPSGSFKRTFTYPGTIFRLVPLRDGRLLMSANLRTPGAIGSHSISLMPVARSLGLLEQASRRLVRTGRRT